MRSLLAGVTRGPLLVADLFCGLGGFDEGARQALEKHGLEMKLVAVNHWSRAILTHRANHPDADARQVDVYETKPLEAIPGGKLDLLMASPTCVYYSRSRGGRPVSWDQRYGRMSPTQVLRWVTDLKVKVLIVENVTEFKDWGPVCKRRTSCKLHGWAGPSPDDPRRDICGKPRRNKAGIYYRRWKAKLQKQGGFKRLEERVLNAADFGDRTTRKRLFLVGVSDDREIRWPIPTHARKAEAGDLFTPARRQWEAARPCIDFSLPSTSIFDRPKPYAKNTLTRIFRGIVDERWHLAFVLKLKLYLEKLGYAVPSVPVRAGSGAKPFVLSQASGGIARPLGAPLPTIPTEGAHALIAPYYGQGACTSLDVPLGTATTRDRFAFVTAQFGERKGQRARIHSLTRPLPTLCAEGRVPLVEGVVLEDLGGVDITLRMLRSKELAKSMGFGRYRLTGTETERTRMVGNAVAVGPARALVASVLLGVAA